MEATLKDFYRPGTMCTFLVLTHIFVSRREFMPHRTRRARIRNDNAPMAGCLSTDGHDCGRGRGRRSCR